jgi:hypothetical protein
MRSNSCKGEATLTLEINRHNLYLTQKAVPYWWPAVQHLGMGALTLLLQRGNDCPQGYRSGQSIWSNENGGHWQLNLPQQPLLNAKQEA